MLIHPAREQAPVHRQRGARRPPAGRRGSLANSTRCRECARIARAVDSAEQPRLLSVRPQIHWSRAHARRPDGSTRDAYVRAKWWGDVGAGLFLKPPVTAVPFQRGQERVGSAVWPVRRPPFTVFPRPPSSFPGVFTAFRRRPPGRQPH